MKTVASWRHVPCWACTNYLKWRPTINPVTECAENDFRYFLNGCLKTMTDLRIVKQSGFIPKRLWLYLVRPRKTMSTWPVLTWPGSDFYNSFASHSWSLQEVNRGKIKCMEIKKAWDTIWIECFELFVMYYMNGHVRTIPTSRVYRSATCVSCVVTFSSKHG